MFPHQYPNYPGHWVRIHNSEMTVKDYNMLQQQQLSLGQKNSEMIVKDYNMLQQQQLSFDQKNLENKVIPKFGKNRVKFRCTLNVTNDEIREYDIFVEYIHGKFKGQIAQLINSGHGFYEVLNSDGKTFQKRGTQLKIIGKYEKTKKPKKSTDIVIASDILLMLKYHYVK